MATQHTPGPWKAEAPSEYGISIVAPSGGSLGCAWPEDLLGNMHDAVANARLIAAAPDLLEALSAAQAALAMMTAPDAIKATSVQHAWAQAVEAEAKARAAIAKAEGR